MEVQLGAWVISNTLNLISLVLSDGFHSISRAAPLITGCAMDGVNKHDGAGPILATFAKAQLSGIVQATSSLGTKIG